MNASCHLNPNKGIWAGQPALSRGLYTNVTECSCFSVCADKLFKVLGMSVIVPSSTLPPFVPCFVSDALSWTVSQVQKWKNAKRLSRCSVCLISPCWMLGCRADKLETLLWRKQSKITAQNNFWSWLATPPSFSPLCLSDPPHHLFSLRSLLLFSILVFIFDALLFAEGFLWWLIWKRNDKGAKKVYSQFFPELLVSASNLFPRRSCWVVLCLVEKKHL